MIGQDGQGQDCGRGHRQKGAQGCPDDIKRAHHRRFKRRL